MKKPLIWIPMHVYVLRVRGRWAVGGNTFNEIFVFFKFLFNSGLFSFAFLVDDGNITPIEEEKIAAWKHMHKVWDSCEDESRTCH
ncbi:hypothetical protein Bca4012_091815 [Brassica carinata]